MDKRQIARECRELKLTKEELAFADLLAVGWDEQNAWDTAIKKGAAWDRTYLKKEITRLAGSASVQARVEAVRNVLKEAQIEKYSFKAVQATKREVAESISKDNMLMELIDAKKLYTQGSPEWTKIQQMIIDVTNMKKEENRDEQQLVHFYLPFNSNCNECRLMMQSRKEAQS